MLPSRAMQRGALPLVPRIATRCRVTGSVRSAVVTPSGAALVSSQWKDARKKAQQAPQDKQGFDIRAATRHLPISGKGAGFCAGIRLPARASPYALESLILTA